MKKKKTLIVFLFSMLLVASFCTLSVGAIETSEGETAQGNVTVSQWDLDDFGTSINGVYEVFRNISVPIAAVAVAYNAFLILTGSAKEMEMCKARIKLIVLAEIAICFVPLVIKAGISLGESYGWNPGTPTIGS